MCVCDSDTDIPLAQAGEDTTYPDVEGLRKYAWQTVETTHVGHRTRLERVETEVNED
jgi:hypothetical protein